MYHWEHNRRENGLLQGMLWRPKLNRDSLSGQDIITYDNNYKRYVRFYIPWRKLSTNAAILDLEIDLRYT